MMNKSIITKLLFGVFAFAFLSLSVQAAPWNQLTGEQLEQQLTEKFAQGKYSNKGAD
ncbi:cystathionine beta-synthase, partial [Shewanella sp. GutCb]